MQIESCLSAFCEAENAGESLLSFARKIPEFIYANSLPVTARNNAVATVPRFCYNKRKRGNWV